MKAYIAKAKCCGAITAGMLDDERTTAKDVADFAREAHKYDRALEHVTDWGEIKLVRCECKRVKRAAKAAGADRGNE